MRKKKSTAQISGTTAQTKRVIGKPFKPGQSGNPGGRPVIPADVVEASRALTGTALATLEEICISGVDESARIKAAVALLDRAWGKPVEHATVSDDRAPLEDAVVVLTVEERAERISALLTKAEERKAAKQQDIAGGGK